MRRSTRVGIRMASRCFCVAEHVLRSDQEVDIVQFVTLRQVHRLKYTPSHSQLYLSSRFRQSGFDELLIRGILRHYVPWEGRDTRPCAPTGCTQDAPVLDCAHDGVNRRHQPGRYREYPVRSYPVHSDIHPVVHQRATPSLWLLHAPIYARWPISWQPSLPDHSQWHC